jgi:hypothetical protein
MEMPQETAVSPPRTAADRLAEAARLAGEEPPPWTVQAAAAMDDLEDRIDAVADRLTTVIEHLESLPEEQRSAMLLELRGSVTAG